MNTPDLTTPAPREFSRYHALCSVHRAAILSAFRKMSIGELFSSRDTYERRKGVLALVSSLTSIPVSAVVEIFPLVNFYHFEDLEVYSEILAAHSAWVADNLDIIDDDDLDREVKAFA